MSALRPLTRHRRPPVLDAARTALIPLRPLTIGEILDGAFLIVRRNLRLMLGLPLVVAGAWREPKPASADGCGLGAWRRAAERSQFKSGSSSQVEKSATGVRCRRSTRRQRSSGSSPKTSEYSASTTCHMPSAISDCSWPAAQPE